MAANEQYCQTSSGADVQTRLTAAGALLVRFLVGLRYWHVNREQSGDALPAVDNSNG